MDSREALEIVDVLRGNLEGLECEAFQAGLVERFDLVVPAAGELATEEAASESRQPDQPDRASDQEEPEQQNVWGVLRASNSEKAEKAEAAITAMAEKYGRPESDFSLVMTHRETYGGKEEPVFTVIMTATDSIDLGKPGEYDKKRSWNAIDPTKKKKAFNLEISEEAIDTRKAETLEALAEVAKINPEINEWVWETGRPDLTDAVYAPIVYVYAGQAGRSRGGRDSDDLHYRFRPAVEIA